VKFSSLLTRVCNPGALFQNWDYGVGRPQNRDPGARTGIHNNIKKQNIPFFVPKK
jgi:hypothetical protein